MLVVDVGCGTSDRVAAIIPIKEYGYRYVGIDSSEVALRRAALNMTESMLIRAHLRTVRLRSEIADVVLCLGVLMYFDDVTDLLGKLVNLLKPGGVLLLHEAMSMRSTESVLGRLRVTEGAPFPEWHGVCRSKVSSQLKEHGKIIHLHLASSPLRRVLSRIPPSPWLRSLRSAGAGLDSIWCGTVGRFAKKLGPAEFQLVFKKAGR
jgi:SAM-dependent methyltransferase